jgi:GTPase SAR1 family protein
VVTSACVPSETRSLISSRLTGSYRQLRSYYRGAVGALLVYDITKHATYANATRWLNGLRAQTEAGLSSAKVVAMLVGNESDLEDLRAMPGNRAKASAGAHTRPPLCPRRSPNAAPTIAQNDLLFVETSPMDPSNVESAFQTSITGATYPFLVKTISLKSFQISIGQSRLEIQTRSEKQPQ